MLGGTCTPGNTWSSGLRVHVAKSRPAFHAPAAPSPPLQDCSQVDPTSCRGLYWYQGLPWPRRMILHLALLKLIRFIWAHFSSLSRSFWMAYGERVFSLEWGPSTGQQCLHRGQTASQDLDSPAVKGSVQFPEFLLLVYSELGGCAAGVRGVWISQNSSLSHEPILLSKQILTLYVKLSDPTLLPITECAHNKIKYQQNSTTNKTQCPKQLKLFEKWTRVSKVIFLCYGYDPLEVYSW